MRTGRPSLEGRRPQGGRCGFLADKRRRRHLAAGHSINGVVHEEDRDFLAAIRGMHDFCCTDSRQVAIALVRNYDFVGTGPLNARGGRRRAAMGDLNVTDVKVIVGEDGAAHGTDQDGLVLELQILDSFRNQFVHHAVAAAWAVMRLVFQFGFGSRLGTAVKTNPATRAPGSQVMRRMHATAAQFGRQFQTFRRTRFHAKTATLYTLPRGWSHFLSAGWPRLTSLPTLARPAASTIWSARNTHTVLPETSDGRSR